MQPQRTDTNIKIDVEHFRTLLESERTRLLALHKRQRGDMEEEARNTFEDDPSRSDNNQTADFAAALADEDRDKAQDVEVVAEVHEIDKALERIASGTYGICIVTGKPIPIERLEDIPWASMTVEAAESGLDFGYSTES